MRYNSRVDGSLLFGALAAAVVAFLAGASGFGFGLLATPLLLLLGFSLPFVVTANLLISLATRVSVAYRLRRRIDLRRSGLLVLGSVPGLYLGAHTLTTVDHRVIKAALGVVVMVAVALLALGSDGASEPRSAGMLAAGFAGGFLGTTTSLNGIPPVLLLARHAVAAVSFFADLAVYSIGSAGIGLGILGLSGGFSGRALFPAFVLWLPAVLAGNGVGTSLGLRLPQRRFRQLTLALAFVAGAITLATAWS